MEKRIKPNYTWKDKLNAIVPGAMIRVSFIGPGTAFEKSKFFPIMY